MSEKKHEPDAYGDCDIGKIEYGPIAYMDKIDHVAVRPAIDCVSKRASQNERLGVHSTGLVSNANISRQSQPLAQGMTTRSKVRVAD